MANADDRRPPPGTARKRRRRRTGWHSLDVLRAAALVGAMYVVARLLWFANPLFLTAFLGVLFGLAVASGVDYLQRWRIPRGVGAALIVLSCIGLIVGFFAAIAPTLRQQGAELRERLPESIDRLETWMNAHRGGVVSTLLGGSTSPPLADTATSAPGSRT
ncbi:MAG TPA: AI-2E family transporter, partial [Gemmatimonadaceae bacterium]|nr:AI-2E family transporter [Gemmatimonadaceae bacterium]